MAAAKMAKWSKRIDPPPLKFLVMIFYWINTDLRNDKNCRFPHKGRKLLSLDTAEQECTTFSGYGAKKRKRDNVKGQSSA